MVADLMRSEQTLEASLLLVDQGTIQELAGLDTLAYLKARRDRLMVGINNYLKDTERFEVNIFDYRNVDSTPII